MIRRPPRSTLFPYTNALPISEIAEARRHDVDADRIGPLERLHVVHLLDPRFAAHVLGLDRKSTRLNSSHSQISYAVFCLKKKKNSLVQQARYHHRTAQI